MTTRFPAAYLPDNMQAYQRALETQINIAENAQDNSDSIIAGMRQSVGSNYGLGSRLPATAGDLTNKVVTNLQTVAGSPAASVTLQRSWTNLFGTITVTTPAFVSNVTLAVAAVSALDITGGSTGAQFSRWVRINVGGGIVATRMMPQQNFGQVLLTGLAVPASTNITIATQIWGFVQNTDNTFVNGTVGTASTVRIATNMRAIALV